MRATPARFFCTGPIGDCGRLGRFASKILRCRVRLRLLLHDQSLGTSGADLAWLMLDPKPGAYPTAPLTGVRDALVGGNLRRGEEARPIYGDCQAGSALELGSAASIRWSALSAARIREPREEIVEMRASLGGEPREVLLSVRHLPVLGRLLACELCADRRDSGSGLF